MAKTIDQISEGPQQRVLRWYRCPTCMRPVLMHQPCLRCKYLEGEPGRTALFDHAIFSRGVGEWHSGRTEIMRD